ncbi:hypothetical protein IB238_02250 [Rhizobium sp. ARZ01]|uniref:hypothetical protein n=1 Tax=Rhizobium sp. ARZ01 TaxID=2769313 RepID=UPI001782DE0E|nr:hypothetical protein [Rhizobium sp. ARZ01]MBD9371461.1 hypothetical protein [Rhizobium sp. ARZ01]
MTTTDHRPHGLLGRLFGGWLERANYDWGCGPIDLPEADVLKERLVCEGDLPSLPRRPVRGRAAGH